MVVEWCLRAEKLHNLDHGENYFGKKWDPKKFVA